MLLRCTLCSQQQVKQFHQIGARQYHRCTNCDLIFLDPSQRLSEPDERARYELHDNNPQDPAYRSFLMRAVEPIIPYLTHSMRGLDYGCGPGPTISVMLAEQGFSVVDYDPIFNPDTLRDVEQFDFITCTEVIEHFYQPAAEFSRLRQLLKPTGVLSVMTEVYSDELSFKDWWYLKDPTHVSLYSAATLEWIGKNFFGSVQAPHKNVRIYAIEA
jgi:2-polyprenyl-3-methyl-5-hydroxy-6-metoxy-1,4-benzoquinol methylase